jgi:protein-disulfide isomerase
MFRTLTLIGALGALTLGLSGCQKTGSADSLPDDMTMGSDKAKVTVVEYASVACPHCAAFNNDVFPAFKAKYIDTGRVKYVAREALTGDPTIATAGFLVARCAGKDKYFDVTGAIYRQLPDMESGNANPRDIMLSIARSAGMTEDKFNACVGDDKARTALQARAEKNMIQDKVNSTPTFIVNGKQLEPGEKTLAELDAAIAEAEKAKGGS